MKEKLSAKPMLARTAASSFKHQQPFKEQQIIEYDPSHHSSYEPSGQNAQTDLQQNTSVVFCFKTTSVIFLTTTKTKSQINVWLHATATDQTVANRVLKAQIYGLLSVWLIKSLTPLGAKCSNPIWGQKFQVAPL